MISCPQCAHENPDGAKFCNECGTLLPSLPRLCPSCGHENLPGAKFCNECGTNLQKSVEPPKPNAPPIVPTPQPLNPTFTAPAQPSLSGERRRVTVLFADLSGSTALGEKFDAEDVFEVMNACFAGLTAIIERHGGFVVKYIGDCIMALFGAPVAHGDDPQRGLRAALEMQEWLTDFSRDLEERKGVPFRMRIGLNFGHVIAGGVGGDGTKTYDVLGDTVNVAQRLEATAEPGTVFISEALRRLTARDFEFSSEGRVRVKGRAEEIEVFRVLGPRAQLPDALNSGQLIGRERELQIITQSIEQLSGEAKNAAPSSHLLALSGEAGIGKTRLMEAGITLAAERAANVHFVSCIEREAVRPFALVRRLLSDLCGLHDNATPEENAAKLVSALSAFPALGASQAPWLPELQNLLNPDMAPSALGAETRKNLIVRGLIEIFIAHCGEAPRLLLIDDAQWLDELSGDALDALAREVAPSGRMVILVAHWPGWTHIWPEEANPQVLKLRGLEQEDCSQLIADLVGTAALPVHVVKTIVERSGGNPYYLREVLQELIEAGHLRRENDVWHAAATLGNFVVPDTIYNALIARLDRLDAMGRAALQGGAIAGLEFLVRLLEVLLLPAGAEQLSGTLRRLETLDFLVEAEPLPHWAFRFRHAAMREVAYDALLLTERKTRHAIVAAWLEETFAGREGEVAAQLAHHHEKAENPMKAAQNWIRAAKDASELFANADALRFFEQALALLDDSDPARLMALEAQTGRGLVQLRVGHFQDALQAWQTALNILVTLNFPPTELALRQAYLLRNLARCHSEMGEAGAEKKTLQQAFRALRSVDSTEANRERSLLIGDRAFALYRQGRFAGAARLGRWSYALAEQANGEKERGDAANLLGLVAQAQGRTDEALNYYQQTQNAAQNCGDLSSAAKALNNRGNVYFHSGRFAEAEQCWQDAIEAWQKIGDGVHLAWALNNMGNLHLARGDFALALDNFRQARTRFHQAGQRLGEAATLAVSGEAYLENQEFAAAIEALRAAQILAKELDAQDLVAYSGTTLAVALLESGDDEAAQSECAVALELSRAIGNPAFEGIARRTLGRIALRKKDFERAASELNAALELLTEHDLRPEQGRTLLALTQWHRATGGHDEAEISRRQALQIFEEIGAAADARRAMEM